MSPNTVLKMKVALLLSGQPRFLDSPAYHSIKTQILERYDCDVYCHFWWSPEGGSYRTAPWSGLGELTISADSEQTIKTLYHPKALQWDPPLLQSYHTTQYERTTCKSTWYNLPSMYLSMQRSYELCKASGQHYDWIIRLRYDAKLTAFPDLNTLPRDHFYVPDYSQFHSLLSNNGFICSAEIADIMMNIYDYRDELYARGATFNDENMITLLVKSKGISYQILPKDQFYIDLYRGT